MKYGYILTLYQKQTCNKDNIHVKKQDIELDYEERPRVIEAREILQNYYKIENIDKYKFAPVCETVAIDTMTKEQFMFLNI